MEHDFTGFAPAKSPPSPTAAKGKSCRSADRLNREHDVQNSIRLGTADIAVLFRGNVGSGITYDGRYFDTGLPKGFSDLFGFRKSDGRAVFIEVKTETGRVRPEQVNFIQKMQVYGALAGVARSVEDARKIILQED